MRAGDVVAQLIQANERQDIDALCAVLTDDCEYENVGMGVCHGPDEVRALLGAFFDSAERMQWEVLAQLEQDGTVMNERVDHFFMPGGKQIDVRVAGYFEVVGDKVRRWRDYFDTAALLSALA